MSTSMSILTGCILLAVAIVFAATRDRWSWKRLVVRGGLAAASVVVVMVLIVLSQRAHNWHSNLPKRQTELWGIAIGATEADVKFLKGEPVVRESDLWEYAYGGSAEDKDCPLYVVRFSAGTVKRVTCLFWNSAWGPSLEKGIDKGATVDQIVDRFGRPSEIQQSQDQLTRVLSYRKYNLVFFLHVNRLVAYGIYDAARGPLELPDFSSVDSNE